MAMRCGIVCARENPAETRTYTDRVLGPSYTNPNERGLLFRFTPQLLFKSSATILLPYVDEMLAGGCNLVVDGALHAHLQGLKVLPEFRRAKVAGYLADNALAHVGNLGITVVKLNVRCDEHGIPYEPAHRLYKSRLFEDDGLPVPVKISGDISDAHIGQIGSYFLTQYMVAGSAAIAAARARLCADLKEIGT
jgi:ribosomal protein S18 acetylase RimI-like enzyme